MKFMQLPTVLWAKAQKSCLQLKITQPASQPARLSDCQTARLPACSDRSGALTKGATRWGGLQAMQSLGCFVCVSVCGCECVSVCVCQSVCVCGSCKICFKLHFCGFQHRLFANICHLIFVSFQSVPIHLVPFHFVLIWFHNLEFLLRLALITTWRG